MFDRSQSPTGFAHRYMPFIQPEKSSRLITSDRDTTCYYCGSAIAAGESSVPFGDNGTFMDWSWLSVGDDQPGELACSDCAAINSNYQGVRTYNQVVVSAQGAYPARKLHQLAYWLCHPPEPPFVFVLANGGNKCQHVWWPATVNHSRELFSICHGNGSAGTRTRWIDHPAMAAVIEPSLAFYRANKAYPFLPDFDRDQPNPYLLRDLDRFEWPEGLYEQLSGMRRDDLWALTQILNVPAVRKGEPLERPDPLT